MRASTRIYLTCAFCLMGSVACGETDPTISVPAKRFVVTQSNGPGAISSLELDENGSYTFRPSATDASPSKQGALEPENLGVFSSMFDNPKLGELVDACNRSRGMAGTDNSALNTCISAGNFRLQTVNFGSGAGLCVPAGTDLSGCDSTVQNLYSQFEMLLKKLKSS